MYFLPKENVLDAEKNECFTILVVNVIELIEKIDPDPKPNRLSFHTLRAPTHSHTHTRTHTPLPACRWGAEHCETKHQLSVKVEAPPLRGIPNHQPPS